MDPAILRDTCLNNKALVCSGLKYNTVITQYSIGVDLKPQGVDCVPALTAIVKKNEAKNNVTSKGTLNNSILITNEEKRKFSNLIRVFLINILTQH